MLKRFGVLKFTDELKREIYVQAVQMTKVRDTVPKWDLNFDSSFMLRDGVVVVEFYLIEISFLGEEIRNSFNFYAEIE